MKRILSLVVFLLVSFVGFAQAPTNYTNINGRYRWIAGMFDSTFSLPKGATPSLRTGGSSNPGALFYRTTDSTVKYWTGTQWLTLSDSTRYVPYTGATKNVNLGQYGMTTKWLQFDTSSQAVTDRRLQWSNDDGTLQFGMTNGSTITQRIGLEQFARVKNVDATQINKGDVVYLYGASGDRAAVKKADNRNDSTSSKTLGVATEDIPVDSVGFVGTFGVVGKLNLSAYSPGDILYLDSIPGKMTKTKPQAPYHLVFIGVVERANAGNGLLFTNVQNGYELEELHNVRITSPVNNRAILAYDSVAKLWKDTTLNAIGGITGNLVSGYLTKATGANTIDTSQFYQNNGKIGLGTIIPTAKLTIIDSANSALLITERSLANDQIGISVRSNGNSGYAAIIEQRDSTVAGTQYQTIFRKGMLPGTGNPAPGGGVAFFTQIGGDNEVYKNLTVYRARMMDSTNYSVGGIRGSAQEIWTRKNGVWDTTLVLNQGNVGIGTGVNGIDSALSVGGSTHLKSTVRMSGLPTAAGTKALRVDANGTLSVSDTLTNGISGSGTTNRVSKFTASGAIGNSSIVDSSSSVAMTIVPSGNVGFGTTTPTNNGANINTVTINGATSGRLEMQSSGTKYLELYNVGPQSRFEIPQANEFILRNPTGRMFSVNSNFNAALNSTNANLLNFGNALTINTYTTSAALELTSNEIPQGYFSANDSLTSLGSYNTNHLRFMIDNTERMRLTTGGLFGIGTSSPDSSLTVQNGARFLRGVRMSGLPSAVGTKALRVDANGTLSVADTLANGVSGTGTTNYIPKFTGTSSIGNSVVREDVVGNIGVNGSPNSFSNFRYITAYGATTGAGGVFDSRTSDGSKNLQLYADNTGGNISVVTNHPLLFYTNGTERMRLDASGNLGIGTSSPAYPLNINKSTNGGSLSSGGDFLTSYQDVGVMLGRVSTTSDAVIATTNGAKGFLFASWNGATNVTRMTLDASGNLGLGVTPSAWSNGGNLQLPNDRRISFSGVYGEVVSNAYYNAGWKYYGTGAAADYSQSAGQHIWYNAPSGTAGNAITFTQAMTLDASGNLGVGTTSPTDKLHAAAGTAAGLSLQATGTGGTTWRILSTDNFASISGGKLGFNNGSYRMVIDGSGNVGIGTTSPTSRLTIQGESTNTITISGTTVERVFNTTPSNTTGNGIIGHNTTTGDTYILSAVSGSALIFANRVAPDNFERMRITSGGNVGIGTTTPGSSLPNGFTSGKLLEINSGAGVADAGISIVRDDKAMGIDIWGGYSSGNFVSYIDNRWNNASSKMTFRVRSLGTPINVMTFDGAGNVGIGTTSPSGRLDIVSASDTYTNIVASSNNTSAVLSLYNSNGTGDGAALGYNLAMRFGTITGVNAAGFSEKMRITSAGELLIGRTTAGARLDIQGTTSNSSAYGLFVRNSGSNAMLVMRNDGRLIVGNGTTDNFVITEIGSAGLGTTSPNASALLDISSTTKGFLPPRMTGAQAEAIASPADGLLVYINNGNGTTITSTGFWGYSGGWVKLN